MDFKIRKGQEETLTEKQRSEFKDEFGKTPKGLSWFARPTMTGDEEGSSFADMSAIMMLMMQVQQSYQQAMLQMEQQFRQPVIEPPPEVTRRSPISIKMQQDQIRKKLQKDLEEERAKRIRLADTVYSDFSLLEEAPPEILKQGLLQRGEE